MKYAKGYGKLPAVLSIGEAQEDSNDGTSLASLSIGRFGRQESSIDNTRCYKIDGRAEENVYFEGRAIKKRV